MAQGSKEKYTDKQKRKAEKIEAGYEEKGVPHKEAEARAWATVNKHSGGGKRAGGSGQKKSESSSAKARQESAKNAAATRENKGSSLESETKQSLLERARIKGIQGRSHMNKDELIGALRRTH